MMPGEIKLVMIYQIKFYPEIILVILALYRIDIGAIYYYVAVFF